MGRKTPLLWEGGEQIRPRFMMKGFNGTGVTAATTTRLHALWPDATVPENQTAQATHLPLDVLEGDAVEDRLHALVHLRHADQLDGLLT
jgi:hypothetical protein